MSSETEDLIEKINIKPKRVVSEETKRKISEKIKEYYRNHPEARKVVSERLKKYHKEHPDAVKGENHPLFGKHHTKESKKKMSEARSGEKNPNFGKHWPEEMRTRISNTLKGKMTGEKNPMFGKNGKDAPAYGRRHTPEELEKMSTSQRGEKGNNWKGGLKLQEYCYKFNNYFKSRVRDFFENCCFMCGKTQEENSKRLSVHHVEYDKSACCNENPTYFVPLCEKCHNKTSRKDRQRWKNMFRVSINYLYNGRCYYTTEEYEKLKSEKK